MPPPAAGIPAFGQRPKWILNRGAPYLSQLRSRTCVTSGVCLRKTYSPGACVSSRTNPRAIKSAKKRPFSSRRSSV